MKVLETRTRKDGIVRRRYRVSPYRCVTTYEIPETVARRLSLPRMERIMARYNAAEDGRRRADRIRAMLDQGWKPAAVAHEAGVSAQYVRKIRASMKR